MRYGAIFLGTVMVTAAFVASALPLDEAERLGNEITNLRALPFGFAAWCDGGTLRMNQDGGARFRVSDSAICRLIEDGRFVCTTDPFREQQPDGAPIPYCYELDVSEAADAI